MSKPKPPKETERLPRFEEHLPGPAPAGNGRYGRRWSGRKNITIWLSEEIIKRCRPHPASRLRKWIEKNFPREE